MSVLAPLMIPRLRCCQTVVGALRRFGQVSSVAEIREDYFQLRKRIAVTGTREKWPADVYVNNELNLTDIKVYGFDYDFTLARYNKEVQKIIYNSCIAYLVEAKQYPKDILALDTDWDFAIRGLHLDITNGFLMKIDCFRYIQAATVYCGRQQVPPEQVKEVYGGYHVAHKDMSNFYGHMRSVRPRFKHLNDLFSLSEAALVMNLMEFFRDNIYCDPCNIISDIGDAIRDAHSSGVFHNNVIGDIGRFINRDSSIRDLLKRLCSAGKELIIITNSSFPFIDTGMRYFVGDDWQTFFCVVIVDARKPQFHTQHWRSFREWDVTHGCPLWRKVEKLEPGHVYQDGNMQELLKLMDWKEKEILYFGDDVYSDLADPSLHAGIRTGCIVPELEHEVGISNSEEFVRRVKTLTGLQHLLERMQMQHSEDDLAKLCMREWLAERDQIRDELKVMFNPQFGSLFRTDQNHTYFSNRLGRFSDLYTSNLSNLLDYTTDHVFYPRRAALPHEAQQRFPAVDVL